MPTHDQGGAMPTQEALAKAFRSLLLALTGAITATLISWLTSTDFGLLTTFIAAFAPTLVNSIKLYIETRLGPPAPPPAPPREPDVAPPDNGFNWPSPPAASGAILLAFALAGNAVAQDRPKAIITGPEKVASGTLLTLRGTDSQGGDLKYLWRITPEISGHLQLSTLEGGAAVQVATFPGRYTITLVVSNPSGADIAYRDLEVTGDCIRPEPKPIPVPVDPVGPKPDDKPAPPPPPKEPTLPAGEFGIAGEVFKAAMLVQSPTRAEDARKLAESCEALAAKIAAGAITSPQDIANEMAASIKSRGSAWSAFSLVVGNKLKELYLSGKLSTAAQWRKLVLEAKIGFDEVAKR
jgi:hypothetical protein